MSHSDEEDLNAGALPVHDLPELTADEAEALAFDDQGGFDKEIVDPVWLKNAANALEKDTQATQELVDDNALVLKRLESCESIIESLRLEVESLQRWRKSASLRRRMGPLTSFDARSLLARMSPTPSTQRASAGSAFDAERQRIRRRLF